MALVFDLWNLNIELRHDLELPSYPFWEPDQQGMNTLADRQTDRQTERLRRVWDAKNSSR